MTIVPRRLISVVCAALFALALAAAGCGGDDGGGSNDAGGESTTNDTAAPSGSDAGDDTDDDAVPEDVEYRATAAGLKAGLGADRVEVDGTTFHIYDPSVAVPGTECTIARAAAPDDATVIIYQDGESTTCG